MKKNEIFIVSIIFTITFCIALLLLRLIAPGLLGIADLELVQSSTVKAPFYETILNEEDFFSKEILLKDPITRVRFKQLLPQEGKKGPTDILGFRNESVPTEFDIITIGDSQTYGVNAGFSENWPSILSNMTNRHVYNMSVGGWGPIEYYYIFKKCLLFRPKAVVIAFYSGNDPMDAFIMAYGAEHWQNFRINPKLSQADAPSVPFPPKESDILRTKLEGSSIAFTPKNRLVSNEPTPAADAGWKIIHQVLQSISQQAEALKLPIIWTVIPTKELVYSNFETNSNSLTKEHERLVKNEKRRIEKMKSLFPDNSYRSYSDVATPLQKATRDTFYIYPRTPDGHPLNVGYKVIGTAISTTFENRIQ